MNPIVNRIYQNGVKLEEREKETSFSYTKSVEIIAYPKDVDLNTRESMFSLAHELGHWEQDQRRWVLLCLITSLSKLPHFLSVLLYPLLLIEESGAWIRARRICKEEKVSLQGFYKIAIRSYMTYLSDYGSKCYVLLLKVIHVGLMTVILSYFFEVLREETFTLSAFVHQETMHEVFVFYFQLFFLVSFIHFAIKSVSHIISTLRFYMEPDGENVEILESLTNQYVDRIKNRDIY